MHLLLPIAGSLNLSGNGEGIYGLSQCIALPQGSSWVMQAPHAVDQPVNSERRTYKHNCQAQSHDTNAAETWRAAPNGHSHFFDHTAFVLDVFHATSHSCGYDYTMERYPQDMEDAEARSFPSTLPEVFNAMLRNLAPSVTYRIQGLSWALTRPTEPTRHSHGSG